ncbi:hypothetical protein [Macrococcus lamae]|uniref:Uncharacterized protein n=1 Tax=Macrococcus lamae TaxID=198484 RepID=A0A4R6BSG2_9STAP|nr:hypothetical protein [Macrococcus lamae]TDM06987.1 hypothetical protein ERX29_09760 [Macrococcus lamae]
MKEERPYTVAFDYNQLDMTIDFDTKTIRKLEGEPRKDQPDWDEESDFKTYRYRYGYIYFNKYKKLFAISYYDKKLMKKWEDDY